MKFAFLVIPAILVLLNGCSLKIGRTGDGGWCTPCIETDSNGVGIVWYPGNQ